MAGLTLSSNRIVLARRAVVAIFNNGTVFQDLPRMAKAIRICIVSLLRQVLNSTNSEGTNPAGLIVAGKYSLRYRHEWPAVPAKGLYLKMFHGWLRVSRNIHSFLQRRPPTRMVKEQTQSELWSLSGKHTLTEQQYRGGIFGLWALCFRIQTDGTCFYYQSA